MTGDGHRTVTPTEDDSETQPGGPQEAGAHQILLGFAEAGGGGEIELFCTPINCCFGGCAPEFGRFRERVAEPPGHLVCQGWGTPCKDLKLLPLKRDREETNCPPKHRVRVRLGARAFSCCAYYPSPPLGECRMPTTISAHHGRDQVEGGVGRRATTVIGTEAVAPNGFQEGGAAGSQSGPRDIHPAFGRVGDGDLEEGVPERETERANVRSVHKSRIRLFSFRPEAQPPQLASELIAKLVVSLGPRARIAEARGGMFTFRVIPTSGVPSASTIVSAWSALRV